MMEYKMTLEKTTNIPRCLYKSSHTTRNKLSLVCGKEKRWVSNNLYQMSYCLGSLTAFPPVIFVLTCPVIPQKYSKTC